MDCRKYRIGEARPPGLPGTVVYKDYDRGVVWICRKPAKPPAGSHHIVKLTVCEALALPWHREMFDRGKSWTILDSKLLYALAVIISVITMLVLRPLLENQEIRLAHGLLLGLSTPLTLVASAGTEIFGSVFDRAEILQHIGILRGETIVHQALVLSAVLYMVAVVLSVFGAGPIWLSIASVGALTASITLLTGALYIVKPYGRYHTLYYLLGDTYKVMNGPCPVY